MVFLNITSRLNFYIALKNIAVPVEEIHALQQQHVIIIESGDYAVNAVRDIMLVISLTSVFDQLNAPLETEACFGSSSC